jgi:hypothetical protein
MRKIELIYFKRNKYNMDDKSTPIESLNRNDDSEVVNEILNKYNNLGNTDNGMPPANPNIPQLEQKFENRNLNQEMFEHNSTNIAYKQHLDNELKRTNNYNSNKNIQENNENDYEDEDYEEYEMVEIPLWRRVLNEIRIPLFIFIFIVIFFNCSFDKLLLKRIPFLGNEYNECNTYGFFAKAFLISVLSYLLIKFIRF